jgi:glyoxylase-like metal-dependent hydrolase (beta-lactamase superfamily II)
MQQEDRAQQPPESAPALSVAELAKTMAVQPEVHEPLPGLFASMGLETVYFIPCGKRSVLVDTGFVHTFDAHLRNFEAAGLDLGTVDAVFATHIHVDHTAALADAQRRLHCPVVAHKNNVSTIESGDRCATAACMPGIGWDFPYQACRVDHPVEDGDAITVGTTTFAVVHLPGHTPGCTGYLWGDGYFITGDVVFPAGILGWNDVHWGSNYLDVIDTMRRLAQLRPKYLIPSHGLPFPYDESVSAGGEQRARAMLEDFRAGPIAQTPRALLASKDRTPRKIAIGEHAPR